MKNITDKIIDLLNEKFGEEEFSDFFLVDLTISKSNKVKIFVDRDHGGITFKDCTRISRHIESYLDESLVLGERYTLDVSSPGLDRGLILRQYPKNIGRKIKVRKVDGEVLKGKLEAVDNKGISLLVEVTKKESESIEIHFEEIEKSLIIVSF